MARKKVYYFKSSITKNGVVVTNDEFRQMFIDMISGARGPADFKVSYDLTKPGENIHKFADVFEYEGQGALIRFSKEKPSGTMFERNYTTYEDVPLLSNFARGNGGVELYTYAYYVYRTGILEIVNSKGAPGETAMNDLINVMFNDLEFELLSVPNTNSIDSIYSGREAKLTNFYADVVLPSPDVLEQMFGWSHNECLEVLSDNSLKMSFYVRGEHRTSISDGSSNIRRLVASLKAIPGIFNGSVKAKAEGVSIRNFNLFDEYFSYEIDVPFYHNLNGERIDYTIDELKSKYYDELRSSYNCNENYFVQLLQLE